jgi:hypothetical protein
MADEIPDNKEIARETHSSNDPELVLETIEIFVLGMPSVDPSRKTPFEALSSLFLEECLDRIALWDRVVREME